MANGEGLENGLPQRAGTTNPDWNSYVPQGHGRTDEQIRADIHEKLARETGAHTRGLAVDVRDGVATVRGSVSSQGERERLLAMLRSVPSLRETRDQLTVESQGSGSTLAHGVDAVRERARQGAQVVQHAASQLSTRTHDYALRAQDYAWRARGRTAQGARDAGEFVTRHALPLALVSASLAYLAWSINRDLELRREARQPARVTANTGARDTPYSSAYLPAYLERRETSYETSYPSSRFET